MSLKIREYMITKIIHEEKIQKAKKYVEKGESFVIVTHVTPDGDAIGSALGLYHFHDRTFAEALFYLVHGSL